MSLSNTHDLSFTILPRPQIVSKTLPRGVLGMLLGDPPKEAPFDTMLCSSTWYVQLK